MTTLPAADITRARQFYEEKLGLRPKNENPDSVMYECGNGTGFLVYPSRFAGQNPATYMGFETEDIESEVQGLKDKGVKFEEYNIPGIKTENSIAQTDGNKAAWFKDTEGNIIGVFQSLQ